LNKDWGETTLEMAPLINAEDEGVNPVINTTFRLPVPRQGRLQLTVMGTPRSW